MWQGPLMKLGSLACLFGLSSYRTQVASSLFLQHNTALVPPYRVLIDTNFINFSLQNKLELVSGMMDCLFAKCMSPVYSGFHFMFRVCPQDLISTSRCPLLFCFLEPVGGVTDVRVGIPCVTDCVMAELEKLGHKYRVALR